MSKKHGGERPNAGRKPDTVGFPATIQFRATRAQKAKYTKLGAAWARKKIDEEPDPK